MLEPIRGFGGSSLGYFQHVCQLPEYVVQLGGEADGNLVVS